VGSALSADPAAPRAPTPRLRLGGVLQEGSMMRSLTDEITMRWLLSKNAPPPDRTPAPFSHTGRHYYAGASPGTIRPVS
jgi:hypothetical protein